MWDKSYVKKLLLESKPDTVLSLLTFLYCKIPEIQWLQGNTMINKSWYNKSTFIQRSWQQNRFMIVNKVFQMCFILSLRGMGDVPCQQAWASLQDEESHRDRCPRNVSEPSWYITLYRSHIPDADPNSLTAQNYEQIINVCCFKLLSIEVVCYMTKTSWVNNQFINLKILYQL